MPQPANPDLLRVADLPTGRPSQFSLRPDAAAMAEIAAMLGLLGLRKLSFSGQIEVEGDTDWRLDATLGATVVQPCVVTLAPVTTRIDETVTRRFLAQLPDTADDEGAEIELPEDDSIEQLGPVIDLADVMREALALALPLYPRAPGASLDRAAFTTPGQTPMSDDDARPFAGLAGLRDKLQNDE